MSGSQRAGPFAAGRPICPPEPTEHRMRALFSSVLAGLLLLSATGVQAQSLALAAGAGSDGVVSGVVGAGGGPRGPEGDDDLQRGRGSPTNETFTVTIRFTEDIRGFTLSDINVRNGSTASSLDEVTDDRRTYEVDIEPHEGVDGDVTVTIRAGAVESISTSQDNVATSEDFPVDTRGAGVGRRHGGRGRSRPDLRRAPGREFGTGSRRL